MTTGALSADAPVEAGEAATLGIRPENVSRGRDGGSHADAEVAVLEQVGSLDTVYPDSDDIEDETVPRVGGRQQFEPGDCVSVATDTDRIRLFADDGGPLHNPPVFTRNPAPAE